MKSVDYDSEAGECPTLDDQFSDAAVRTSPLVEPGFGDRSGFPFGDAEAEAEYLSWLADCDRAEAALALAAVRTGEPQQAAAPVYSIQMAVLESGRFRASVYRGKLRLWRATFGGEGEAWEQARGLVGELLEDEGPSRAA